MSPENDPVPLYRDDAIVLRTHRLGEADRIITVLTRRHGRLRAVAKGVRRTGSRFGSRLEPFSHVDLQCHTGRSLDIVTQVELLDGYGALLVEDYARWTAAQAMVEAAERLTPEEAEPAPAQYALLVAGLRSLAGAAHPHGLVLDAYLLRCLAVAGWAPSFDACAECASPGPHRAFSLPAGGMVCSTCRPAGVSFPNPATVTLLGALLSGDWARADASGPRERQEASGLVAAYLRWHVERGLRSLALVER